MRIMEAMAERLMPTYSELDKDNADLLTEAVHHNLSEDELARYCQLAPELAPVFDAIISNHDETPPSESLTDCWVQ